MVRAAPPNPSPVLRGASLLAGALHGRATAADNASAPWVHRRDGGAASPLGARQPVQRKSGTNTKATMLIVFRYPV